MWSQNPLARGSIAKEAWLSWRRRRKIPIRLSMVVPCYNVENYIDEFFASIFAQSVDPRCLEIIAVDDGSTDGTASAIERWRNRHPDRIRLIRQVNRGQAAARNTGLQYVTGEWLTFPDPDDFLDRQYVFHVARAIQKTRKAPLSMVACNIVFYREAKNKIEDSHPLRYKFEAQTSTRQASNLKTYIQLSAASAWFRRDMIEKYSLRFNTQIVPTFEDSDFVNRFLIVNPDSLVDFLRDAVYYYRQRATSDSTQDAAKSLREYYIDQLEYGNLALLRWTFEKLGRVPRFIQRTVLYNCVWKLRYLLDYPERATQLTDAEKEKFLHLLFEIFRYVDCSTINNFSLAGCYEAHKVGILNLLKGARRPLTRVYVKEYDHRKQLVRLLYHSPEQDVSVAVKTDGTTASLLYRKSIRHKILSETYAFEHSFWVPLAEGQFLTVEIDGISCPIRNNTTELGERIPYQAVLRALAPQPVDIAKLSAGHLKLRKRAARLSRRAKFGDCWLLMDRDSKADDNAEHLYRYLRAIEAPYNVFFVLRRSSPDWTRLSDDGFRLLEFDSAKHKVAALNARFIISSHGDDFIRMPLPPASFRDMLTYDFVYLKHGVALYDLSRSFNKIHPARLITAALIEQENIVDEQSNYRLTEKEVVLTGLPRHDSLLAGAKASPPDHILIIPTWRRYLVGLATGPDRTRPPTDEVSGSEYALRWRSILHSERLREIAESAGAKITFCPHPKMTKYDEYLETPSYADAIDITTARSIQPMLLAARIAITDYSSTATDVAYLDRAVVYYQFDEEEFFAKHSYRKGTFDFRLQGFGPVCRTESEVLENVAAVLEGREDPAYQERRLTAFAFRDGRCCQRVYESILCLEARASRSCP